MKKLSIQTLETAAEWLRCNEGDDGEAEDCHSVADWLQSIAAGKVTREAERIAAKSLGIPVRKARRFLRSKEASFND